MLYVFWPEREGFGSTRHEELLDLIAKGEVEWICV
jgi:hypothetical protein